MKEGELSAGMELSYAPAEFYAEDGKTPVGYDIDMTKAIAKTLGLKPNIVSSMFDTIIPSIGSKYDLGITAMTITEERMQSVDFVSYYRAGSTWAVKKGNPKKLDTSDMCGAKIAVQTGTVQEEEANTIAKGCEADNKAEVMSYKRQAEAATAVATGKADAFYADSPGSPAMPSPRPTDSLKLWVTSKVWPSRASLSRRATPSLLKPCRRPYRS